jgi:hypothetical protein
MRQEVAVDPLTAPHEGHFQNPPECSEDDGSELAESSETDVLVSVATAAEGVAP